MRRIHPIDEPTCREHYGKPVLIVLRDGSELVAILSRHETDKLILNSRINYAENAVAAEDLQATKASLKSKKAKVRGKSAAKVKAVAGPGFRPGFGPGFGGEFAIDLSLIALLFLLI